MLYSVTGFDWDDGNRDKCRQHGLPIDEVEFVLMHAETLIVPDLRNSVHEPRFVAIGPTTAGRFAFVVFTPRSRHAGTFLRPISARYMHRKEMRKYEQEIARLQKR